MRTTTAVLASFCEAIEATGGMVALPDGNHAPLADEEWIDLGALYLEACAVLGREAKIEGQGEEDSE